jgi:outer membrane lipoprotein SlyB
MNIAAVAVIIASVAAVGAIFGLIPAARSERTASVAPVADKVSGQFRGRPDKAAPAPGGESASSAVSCGNCGVVEAVREMQIPGEATGPAAVGGGVTGAVGGSQIGRGNGSTAMGVLGAVGGAFAGHAIEKNVRTHTGYRMTVRMDDGTVRTVYSSAPPAFAAGDKVRLINGAPAARG